ncbi:MAG: hypothetical protein HYT89_05130 [Candidatus Omnitrophica bacterium]|nr:hypothetical protein [Candidatus Omnitrophota bacterium]
MSIQHKDLAAGRWQELPLLEQMAHIGGEVERAIQWKEKKNADYSSKACERALELLDFALDSPKNRSHLKEIARIREVLVDDFWGANQFASSDASWRRYFMEFAYAARRGR